MEIRPASMTQVLKGKDGRMVLVEDDVLAVARGLLDIDPKLRLRYSEDGAYFVVYWLDGIKERLVLTSQEMTPQIVERVRQIQSSSYDYVDEIERMDKEADKRRAQQMHEEVGEVGETLAHALRKDLQAKNKIIVPKDIREP